MRRAESQVSRVGTLGEFHCWNILLCLCYACDDVLAPPQQVKCYLSFVSLEFWALYSGHIMHTHPTEWKGRKGIFCSWGSRLLATLLILITGLWQEWNPFTVWSICRNTEKQQTQCYYSTTFGAGLRVPRQLVRETSEPKSSIPDPTTWLPPESTFWKARASSLSSDLHEPCSSQLNE